MLVARVEALPELVTSPVKFALVVTVLALPAGQIPQALPPIAVAVHEFGDGGGAVRGRGDNIRGLCGRRRSASGGILRRDEMTCVMGVLSASRVWEGGGGCPGKGIMSVGFVAEGVRPVGVSCPFRKFVRTYFCQLDKTSADIVSRRMNLDVLIQK